MLKVSTKMLLERTALRTVPRDITRMIHCNSAQLVILLVLHVLVAVLILVKPAFEGIT